MVAGTGLHGGPVGFWIWDVRQDRVLSDTRLLRYLGLDPEGTAEGEPLATYLGSIHEDDRKHTSAAIWDAVRNGSDFRHAYRVRDNRGRWRRVAALGKCFVASDLTIFPGLIIDLDARDGRHPTGLRRLGVLLQRANAAESNRALKYILEVAMAELADVLGSRHEDGHDLSS